MAERETPGLGDNQDRQLDKTDYLPRGIGETFCLPAEHNRHTHTLIHTHMLIMLVNSHMPKKNKKVKLIAEKHNPDEE